MEHSPWKPICTGDLADQVWRTVQQIASSLEPSSDLPAPLLAEMQGPSLAGGQGGAAILLSYLATEVTTQLTTQLTTEHARDKTLPGVTEDQAVERLERIMEQAASNDLAPNLYGGVAGVAWTLEHLAPRLFEADDEDLNEDVDELLITHLSKVPWIEDYDLVSGLVGLGVYGLERLPRQSAVTLLEKVVDHLDAWSEPKDGGLTWLTRPHLLWEETARLFPKGCYNLGLAHGVPGIVALLGEICAAGVALDRARPLLEGAVTWLLAQRLKDDPLSCFTDLIGPEDPSSRNEPLQPSRTAWCYGDPGVAVALLGAAAGAGREDWRTAALDIARRAALRNKEQARVNDAGLCHGAAGLAHLFNRMYQATGDVLLKDAALRWVEQTLAMGDGGNDRDSAVGGFLSWEPKSPGGEFFAVPRTGLLTGTAGIGLALLATVSNQEPRWDRMLLAAVPPLPTSTGLSISGSEVEAALLRVER